MDVVRVAGIVMVAGVIVFFVAVIPGPNVYGIQDTAARLAKLHADEAAFRLSQALFALGALLVAAGFALLAIWLTGQIAPVLPAGGALATAVGAVLWTAYMVARALDPDSHFGDYGRAPAYAWLSFVSTAVGIGVFGYLLLDIDATRWVGVLTIAVSALAVTVAVVAPQVAPPQLLYLPPLVIGCQLVASGWPAAMTLGGSLGRGL